MSMWLSAETNYPGVYVFQVHFVRDIEGVQFSEALDKHLLPRMQISGEDSVSSGLLSIMG